MKCTSMRRYPDICIDGRFRAHMLLSEYQHKCRRILRARAITQRRTFAVELLRFSELHVFDMARIAIMNMKNRRFLDAYELLMFDRAHPHVQQADMVATHEFILGVDPEDLPPNIGRSIYGKVIEDMEDWHGKQMPKNVWYATVPFTTLVDSIRPDAHEGFTQFEQWLEGYLKKPAPVST